MDLLRARLGSCCYLCCSLQLTQYLILPSGSSSYYNLKVTLTLTLTLTADCTSTHQGISIQNSNDNNRTTGMKCVKSTLNRTFICNKKQVLKPWQKYGLRTYPSHSQARVRTILVGIVAQTRQTISSNQRGFCKVG